MVLFLILVDKGLISSQWTVDLQKNNLPAAFREGSLLSAFFATEVSPMPLDALQKCPCWSITDERVHSNFTTFSSFGDSFSEQGVHLRNSLLGIHVGFLACCLQHIKLRRKVHVRSFQLQMRELARTACWNSLLWANHPH